MVYWKCHLCLYKRHSVNVNEQIQILLYCTVLFYSISALVNVNGAAIIWILASTGFIQISYRAAGDATYRKEHKCTGKICAWQAPDNPQQTGFMQRKVGGARWKQSLSAVGSVQRAAGVATWAKWKLQTRIQSYDNWTYHSGSKVNSLGEHVVGLITESYMYRWR